MLAAANELKFEESRAVRDQIKELQRMTDGRPTNERGDDSQAGELRQKQGAKAFFVAAALC